MTAAHYKGGHHPGNDLGLHYTALPPIVAPCPYSDQLLVTRKFWSPGANRPSQANRDDLPGALLLHDRGDRVARVDGPEQIHLHDKLQERRTEGACLGIDRATATTPDIRDEEHRPGPTPGRPSP